jgi:hypothetical protein
MISAAMSDFPRGGVKSLRNPTNTLAVAVAELQIHLDAAKFGREVASGVRPEVVTFSADRINE